VYVRGGGKAKVGGIRDGTYEIVWTEGRDWDNSLHAFTRDCAFQRFEDPFSYTTTPRTYQTQTITLRPVVGGNARTGPVEPESIPFS
jgi:hypothetical protein